MENNIYEDDTLGMTYQMTIDSFLEHPQDCKEIENKTYHDALQHLNDAKKYRSWEKKRNIAKESLHICEDCIEAYLLWGRYCENEIEAIQIYKNGMEKAMFQLGKDYFRKNIHDFYEDEKARPFLHILYAYGGILYEAGYMKKAKEQFEKLISLHPNDCFRSRYYLWCIYLYFEDLDQCYTLLQKYQQQSDTYYQYIQMLYYYKVKDMDKVKAQISLLKNINRYLYELCTYKRRPRLLRNEDFEAGSLQEAMYCFAILKKVIHHLEFLPKHLLL